MTISFNESNDPENTRDKYIKLSDDKLLILIGNERDRIALAEIYDRYRQSLGRYLQRGAHETKLADEVYNDVMLTVWSKANSFRGESKVSTWIFGIANRTRMTHSRKENRHTQRRTGELIDDNASENDNSLGEALHAALVELSDQHRAVIELAYFHGYSTAEIATIVDCPQNTVKTRLFHARQKLKAIIEADELAGGRDRI